MAVVVRMSFVVRMSIVVRMSFVDCVWTAREKKAVVCCLHVQRFKHTRDILGHSEKCGTDNYIIQVAMQPLDLEISIIVFRIEH